MKKIIIILLLFLSYFSYSQDSKDSLSQIDLEEFTFVDRKIQSSTSISLSKKDFKKLAASFDDPSRLLMHYAGFAASGDQSNAISYHGLYTTLFGWQLNGQDIVNPNHLPSAGTAADLASTNAGGVNAFSGNVINKYEFKTPFSVANHSPFVGGMSNVTIDSLDRSYAQLSLLGAETGFKGKFNALEAFVNYRYSFTGLLSDLGVKFGNEDIRYQDVIAGISLKKNRYASKLTAVYGNSTNKHVPLEDSLVTTIKDRLDIYHKSKLLILQLLHKHRIRSSYHLNVSLTHSNRTDISTLDGFVKFDFANDYFASDLYKGKDQKTLIDINVSDALGVKMLETNKNVTYDATNVHYKSDQKVREWTPYVKAGISKFGIHMDFMLGILVNKDLNPIYTINVFTETRRSKFEFSVSKSVQNNYLLFDDKKDYEKAYSNSLNMQLSFEHQFTKQISLSISPFYHNILSQRRIELIDINYYYNFYGPDFSPDMHDIYVYRSKPYEIGGISLNTQYSTDDFYLSANGTYIVNDRDIAYTYDYAANLNLEKDFRIKKNTISVSSSFHIRASQPLLPILGGIHTSLPDYSKSALLRLSGNYARLDLRINYTLKHSLWSLDIQNVLGRLNHTHIINEKSGLEPTGGLGTIPVLTYKRFFN
jgi:hypothetical protein